MTDFTIKKFDRNHINIHREFELIDWSDRFGVTPERLKEVVGMVGPLASEVAKYLAIPEVPE